MTGQERPVSENGAGTAGRAGGSRTRRARWWRAGVAALATSAVVAGGLAAPASAAPAAPTGYLEATAAGGVFGFGGAVLAGSPAASGLTVRSPIVAIVETPTGKGYWLVG